MKKLIFISLMLLSLSGFTQTKGGYQQQTQQQVNYGVDNWYTHSNQYGGTPTYGYSSFLWGITRSQYHDADGYYKYKVWFTSTSYIFDHYYQQAVWKYTYIWDVKIYVDGYLKVSNSNGFSFKKLFNASHITFYSRNAYPRISLSAYHKML